MDTVLLCFALFSLFHTFLQNHAISLPLFFCVASLAVWGIQSMAYFRHFNDKYLTNTFWFSLVFHVDWYKLTSKPSEANSRNYANIYQGFISNMGLNHMQYAVFTNNQSKGMLFVPLIRNMNCAITYIMFTKGYHVYDKYIHGLKTNILEQIIHVSASLWLAQQTDKRTGRSSRGVFLTWC